MSTPGAAPVVVALVTDLMDRSRLDGLGAEVDLRVVRSADAVAVALAERAGEGSATDPSVTVVVDLARPDALAAVSAGVSAAARVLAYGSHVDRERLDAAHAAGAEVLARSAFFSRLGDLLTAR